MTLPTSGTISTDQIMAELRTANPGRAYPLNLLDADVLALAGKSGPPVTIPNDFWGKSVVPPFSVTAANDSAMADTRSGPGTVGCSPGVNVVGGSGSKSYAWTVLSNARGVTVALSNNPWVSIQYDYRLNENGSAEVTLRCTVTDEAGAQRTVDVTGYLEWNGNL